MSDREFSGNDDLSLPKATVQKIITEILAHDPGVAFARETRDLLIECCVEFITLISSEANEIAEKEAKKTIACEHVTMALKSLGYESYVPEILKVAQEHKVQQVGREKKQNKIEQSGMTEEELIAQQQELFRSATNKFTAGEAESDKEYKYEHNRDTELSGPFNFDNLTERLKKSGPYNYDKAIERLEKIPAMLDDLKGTSFAWIAIMTALRDAHHK